MAAPNARFLVTDAAEKLGYGVVRELISAAGVSADRIVAGAPDPSQLKELAALGVITRQLDCKDAASVKAAAQGVDRVFLMAVKAAPGQIFPQHKTTIDALVAAGVQHIVFISLRNLDQDIPTLIADDIRQTEAHIKKSKFSGYTFLRTGPPYEIMLNRIPHAAKSGEWYTASKGGKFAGLGGRDIARAGALALVRAQDADQKIYELTGTETISVATIAAQVNQILGRSGGNAIQVVEVSTDVLAKKIAVVSGLPEEITATLASFEAAVAAGHTAGVTDHFKQLTGSDPQTHTEWFAANAEVIKSL